jgi:hypothetical protein
LTEAWQIDLVAQHKQWRVGAMLQVYLPEMATAEVEKLKIAADGLK